MATLQIDPPNEKQLEFFRARARFVAYGGARGGGKSWAVRVKAALMAFRYEGIRILVLRRTFPELRENHILPMKALLRSAAVYRESDKAFTFPNGSRIVFGYCATEGDVDQYQGQEYDAIFIDEATHFTEYQYSTLTACLRGANNFPKRMYLTCNPGGVGHMWVKRLFVDRAFREGERPEDYVFIQAKVTDNPAVLEHDPDYVRMLDNLPDGLRQAWRDGRWDVFAGQYFGEFRREVHVVKPFVIPPEWPRYRSFDYGLDMFACYWFAIDFDDRVWLYREYCKSGLIVSEAAQAMRQLTLANEHIQFTVAPPDMWSTQRDTGRTMAEIFTENGIGLVRSSNQRVQGWMVVKEFLKIRADGRPGLLITEDCPQLIRDLPAIQHDEKNPSDCAKEPHYLTHSCDAVRYGLIYRTMGARTEPVRPEPEEDALEGYDEYMTGGSAADGYLSYGG